MISPNDPQLRQLLGLPAASAPLPTSVGYQPGLQPGMDPWASRNLTAQAGNPWGYQYDPRFQEGYSYQQRMDYDDYIRDLTGTERQIRTAQPGGQGVVGGIAGQTYASGGDLAGQAAATRAPGYGSTGPMASAGTAPSAPAPMPAPMPTPSPIAPKPPAPAPTGTDPFGGGGTTTPGSPFGSFTAAATPQTYSPGGLQKPMQAMAPVYIPGQHAGATPATQTLPQTSFKPESTTNLMGVLPSTTFKAPAYTPPATQTFNTMGNQLGGSIGGVSAKPPSRDGMTYNTMGTQFGAPIGYQVPQELYPVMQATQASVPQELYPVSRALPGGATAGGTTEGMEYQGMIENRALPGGTGGATGEATAGGTTGGTAPPYSPGYINALTGFIGNLTGGLEAYQKAQFGPNAMNWMQDLANRYSDPRALGGPGALESLLTGQQAYGNSPAMWALNYALQNGIYGQDIIPGIANQLITQENANPLAAQARNIYSQLLSGELSPANTRGIEASVGQALGLTPELMQSFRGAAGVTPNVLNQAAGYINPGAAQGMINQNLINRGAGMVGPENPNVVNFTNDILTKGLQGGFEDAFRRRYYEPAREQLVGNLAQRGVLDSGQRMKEEADLLQQNYLDSLMMQDLGARQQAAGIAQAGRGLDIQGAQALGGLGGQNVNAARALSDIGLGSAGSLGNLAQTNLGYSQQLADMLGRQQQYALQGYGATTPLMADILSKAAGEGGSAEQRALQRLQTGMGSYGQLNQDLARYLGLGTEATLGAGRLGLEGENAATQRYLAGLSGAGGLLGQLGQLGLQGENMYMSSLIDMINAAVAQQTGEAARSDTRSAQNKQLIGQGIGSIATILASLSTRLVKRDIKPYHDNQAALERVNRIPLRTWKFKEDFSPDQKERLGWIIEEVEPEFSNGQIIDLHSVLGHLVASIQELTKEIERLKAEK